MWGKFQPELLWDNLELSLLFKWTIAKEIPFLPINPWGQLLKQPILTWNVWVSQETAAGKSIHGMLRNKYDKFAFKLILFQIRGYYGGWSRNKTKWEILKSNRESGLLHATESVIDNRSNVDTLCYRLLVLFFVVKYINCAYTRWTCQNAEYI